MSDTASDEYRRNLQDLQQQRRFKGFLVKYEPVKRFIERYHPKTVLDFGCAHGTLVEKLREDFPKMQVDGYDPGVPEYSVIPLDRYDCLISNDVIEHFEPEYLDRNLRTMDQLFSRTAWLIIACYPAKKLLPDGRNAHLVVESPQWWIHKVRECFADSRVIWSEVTEIKPGRPELRLILEK